MATAIVAVHPAERPVIVSRDAGLAATLQALVHPSRPPVDVAAAAPALRHVPTPARRGGGPAAHAAAPAHRAWAPTTTSTPASMIGSPARGHPVGPVATGPSSSHRSSVRLTPSPRRATGGIDAPDRWPAAGHVAPTSPPTGLAGLVGWWESEQASAAGHDVVGPSRRLTVDAPAQPSELDGDGAEPLTVFRNALELVLLDEALDAGLEVD